MKHLPLICCVLLVSGCGSGGVASDAPAPSASAEARPRVTQTKIDFDTGHPSIGIPSYSLVSAHPDRERADAEAIMLVKRDFPLAVQTKDRAIFERILARDFVFRGEPGVMDRETYIGNRTGAGFGRVYRVDYQNVALQFFGDTAVMPYRNVVQNVDDQERRDVDEYIDWADIYVKEDGAWKIASVHVIDYREVRVGSNP